MAREEAPDVMQLFLKYLEGTCAARTPWRHGYSRELRLLGVRGWGEVFVLGCLDD